MKTLVISPPEPNGKLMVGTFDYDSPSGEHETVAVYVKAVKPESDDDTEAEGYNVDAANRALCTVMESLDAEGDKNISYREGPGSDNGYVEDL